MMAGKMMFLFQGARILRFHVKLPGCKQNDPTRKELEGGWNIWGLDLDLDSSYALPKFNMESKNDGVQVRNLLFLLVPISGEPC